VSAFEKNKAGTKTMLSAIEVFMTGGVQRRPQGGPDPVHRGTRTGLAARGTADGDLGEHRG